jgi:hypothetical protein
MARIDFVQILTPITRRTSLALTIAATTSCGGTDDNGYKDALAAAEAKTAEARSLAATSPCSDANQCGLLQMHEWLGPCPNYFYEPYSLVASGATAASAAAAAQIPLAIKAASLGPSLPIACAALVTTPPRLQCVASTCSTTGS